MCVLGCYDDSSGNTTNTHMYQIHHRGELPWRRSGDGGGGWSFLWGCLVSPLSLDQTTQRSNPLICSWTDYLIKNTNSCCDWDRRHVGRQPTLSPVQPGVWKRPPGPGGHQGRPGRGSWRTSEERPGAQIKTTKVEAVFDVLGPSTLM